VKRKPAAQYRGKRRSSNEFWSRRTAGVHFVQRLWHGACFVTLIATSFPQRVAVRGRVALANLPPRRALQRRPATIEDRPQCSIPLERDRGREIPSLPNLSEHTSEHPSNTILPPSSAYPGGGCLCARPRPFYPISLFRGYNRFLLVLPQDPRFRSPKYLPTNRCFPSLAQPASARREGQGVPRRPCCVLCL
jgi:hypothetical protein